MKKIILALLILTTTTTARVYALTAVYTVTKTTDDGTAGTLRYAIQNPGLYTSYSISIQTNGTITLASPLPVITVPVAVNCTDAAGITVSGDNLYRVFEVNIPTGTVSFKNLNIINGKGDGGGGGVLAITSTSGKVTFENCTFTGCAATGSQAYGGTIESSADVDLLNCTLTGNSAADGGGAIEMLDPLSVLTINHSTIVQNSTTTANIAGGIDLYLGKITMTNSIVGYNSNGNIGSERDISEDITNTKTQTSSYNLYTTAPFAGTGDLTNKSIIQLAISPLASNGGMVKTMAIGLSSLARNSGTGTFATDARGFTRDANPDMGAYEAPTPTATTSPATGIIESSAVLNGVYDPKGIPDNSAQFEYGTVSGFYTHAVIAVVEPNTFVCSFSLTNLAPNTKTYYRLAATVDGVKFYGDELSFTTSGITSVGNTNMNVVEIRYHHDSSILEIAGAFDFVEVYNVAGSLLQKTTAPSVRLTGNGVAIIRIHSQDGIITRKIVL